MTTRQIAYRLKAEGKTELRRDQQEVAQGFKETYAAAEQGAAQATAAADRLEKRYRAMAQAAQDSAQAQASQARFNAALGVREPARGSAAASASVFMQDETDLRRVETLRAAIDPLTAAQNKLNHELKEYDTLAKAGRLSTAELAQLQGQARVRFDETAAAIARNEKGLTRLALASRLNLTRQASDVFVTAAMGMNPAMIAIQQGPQILDALATSGFKARASLLLVGGALSALAVAAGVTAVAWNDGDKSAKAYERTVTGLGRTSNLSAAQMEALAEASAKAGKVTVSAAQEQMTAYLETGRIGGEMAAGLVAIGRDYATMFGVDMPTATKQLADSMLDPLTAGRQLTVQMGLLDQQQLRNIESLMKSGDLLAAQKILFDELKGAVSGHAANLGEVESAWSAIALAAKNAWEWTGRALKVTKEERLAHLISERRETEDYMAGGRGLTRGQQRRYDEQGREAWALQTELNKAEADRQRISAESMRNRDAELARLRGIANRTTRTSRSDTSSAEAERKRRETLQRARREEDRAAMLDLEAARARQDFAEIQRLEDANAVRMRERQLIDDGTQAEQARTKAVEEQQRLIEARGVMREREVRQIIDGVELEASRIDGLTRLVTRKEREAEIEARILAYRKQEMDLVSATSQALSDQAVIDAARATAAERNAAVRERERNMALASASGDRGAIRALEREDWIERQARQIESDRKLNFGEGRDQAIAEYGQLMRAETLGGMRDGLRGLIGDIRRGGIREALANQFDNAADRLLNKLIDGFLDFDFSGGSGKGVSSWISKGVDFLFGRNAEGTDFWTGGPTWVGERGPELLDLPRGSRVIESARSMDMVRRATTGGAQPIVVKAVYAPSHTISGVDTERLEGLLAQDRAEFEGRTIATVNDAIARRQIAS